MDGKDLGYVLQQLVSLQVFFGLLNRLGHADNWRSLARNVYLPCVPGGENQNEWGAIIPTPLGHHAVYHP
jgi:hypothetical protein